MPKHRTAYRIDAKPLISVEAGTATPTEDLAPPALPSIEPPTGLALTTATGTSTAAPTATISATWVPPGGLDPAHLRYTVQVSESSSFPAATTRTETAAQASIGMYNFKPTTLYYVRVAARFYNTPSAYTSMSPLVDNQNRITTASDTTAAGVPTSIAASFIGTGDLFVTWVNPAEANFKDVRVRVRASSGGTILHEGYYRGPLLWTAAQNLAATGGAGDPSLYTELASRTFSDVHGTTVNTGLITKSAPSAPTLTHSWSGDTGTAGADLVLSWTAVTDAAKYRLTLNGGTARDLSVTTFTYTLEANRSQNTTADPTITYSLVAVDGLLQSSTAASGTATNAAPPTPTVTLTQGAVAGVTATAGGTRAADFKFYEFVFKRDATTAATVESAAQSVTYGMGDAADAGYHSWTCVVRQKDQFDQYSGTVTSSAVAFEALTLFYLRSGITYEDSISTAPATLKTAMADAVTDAGGTSYNA